MKKLIVIQALLLFLCMTVSITAQDTLQLKVQTLNGDGTYGDDDVIYEIVDDSQFYVITDGIRTESFLDAEMLSFEEIEGGAEVTSYKLFKEGKLIYTFGIIDMRHMNSKERLAVLKIDIPILLALQEGEELEYAKGEIVKGKITKNKDESVVEASVLPENFDFTFQSVLADEVTFILRGYKFTIQNSGVSLKTIDLEYIGKDLQGDVILYIYKMKDFEYDYFALIDLRAVDEAEIAKEFSPTTKVVLGFGNMEDGELTSMEPSEVKIIEGEF